MGYILVPATIFVARLIVLALVLIPSNMALTTQVMKHNLP